MTAITFISYDKLSDNEVRELSLIVINPFKMTARVMDYLRKAQDEYFKRLTKK